MISIEDLQTLSSAETSGATIRVLLCIRLLQCGDKTSTPKVKDIAKTLNLEISKSGRFISRAIAELRSLGFVDGLNYPSKRRKRTSKYFNISPDFKMPVSSIYMIHSGDICYIGMSKSTRTRMACHFNMIKSDSHRYFSKESASVLEVKFLFSSENIETSSDLKKLELSYAEKMKKEGFNVVNFKNI